MFHWELGTKLLNESFDSYWYFVNLFNLFQPVVAFHIETIHAKQVTGFHMKRSTGLKLVKKF